MHCVTVSSFHPEAASYPRARWLLVHRPKNKICQAAWILVDKVVLPGLCDGCDFNMGCLQNGGVVVKQDIV